MRLGSAEAPILKKELVMSSRSEVLVDAAGPRRSPATIPGHLAGRAPRNNALIAVLWRGGLRIIEAVALTETDIHATEGLTALSVPAAGSAGPRCSQGELTWVRATR